MHWRLGGEGYLIDCQADLLGDLDTRFVAPLLPMECAPRPAGRLNPVFEIDGVRCVMVAQFAAGVTVRELGERLASLATHDHEIVGAFDFLLSGV